MKKILLASLLIMVPFFANANPTGKEGPVTQPASTPVTPTASKVQAKEIAPAPSSPVASTTAPAPSPSAASTTAPAPSSPAASTSAPTQDKGTAGAANSTSSTPPVKDSTTPSNAKKTNTKDSKNQNTEEVKKGCIIKPVMADEDYYDCGTKPPSNLIHFKDAK